MKKNPPSYRDEMVDLRERMANLETKLSLINEPLLVDALSYELLGLRARLALRIAPETRGAFMTARSCSTVMLCAGLNFSPAA